MALPVVVPVGDDTANALQTKLIPTIHQALKILAPAPIYRRCARQSHDKARFIVLGE